MMGKTHLGFGTTKNKCHIIQDNDLCKFRAKYGHLSKCMALEVSVRLGCVARKVCEAAHMCVRPYRVCGGRTQECAAVHSSCESI